LKILLISPAFDAMEPHFQLGLLYLAAQTRDRHDVKVLDLTIQKMTRGELLSYIRAEGFHVVGITAMTFQINPAHDIAGKIKQSNPHIKVIMGGMHSTALFSEVLKDRNIDFVVVGEGESTFLELLERLEAGGDTFSDIKGIAYRDNGSVHFTGLREFVDINKLKFPARDLVPMAETLPENTIFGQPAMDILLSRGCPGACIFCASCNVWKKKLRLRSIESMVEEITHLKDTYRVRYFKIMDDLFINNKESALRFCEAVTPLKIRFTCGMRINIVDEEILKAMKRAGAVNVLYGVETGSKEIMKKIKKGASIEKIREVFALHKKVGSPATASVIVGHPYETEDDLKQTVQLIRDLDPFFVSVQYMTPYPGTELFQIAPETGETSTFNWDEYYLISKPIYIPNDLDEATMIRYYQIIASLNAGRLHLMKKLFQVALRMKTDIFNRKLKTYIKARLQR